MPGVELMDSLPCSRRNNVRQTRAPKEYRFPQEKSSCHSGDVHVRREKYNERDVRDWARLSGPAKDDGAGFLLGADMHACDFGGGTAC